MKLSYPSQNRSKAIDFIKGIAIISVILYHSGFFHYGYLGVDVFLVIAGYFTTQGILLSFDRGTFKYYNFLGKRLIRLWPLLLVVSLVSFLFGYFWMLPMAVKNTAETVAGTSLFLNNFVQYITSSNYWDSCNDYKPLMHTWYVALVFQFYIVYPLFLILAKGIGGGKKYVYVLLSVLLISLLLYLSPLLSIPQKFYLLPARMFEFAAGGLVVLLEIRLWNPDKRLMALVSIGLLILLLSINENLEITQVKLLCTVSLTCCLISWSKQSILENSLLIKNTFIKGVVTIGRASYSFYLWHQVILAFYRYVFNDVFALWDCVIIFVICAIVSCYSYRYIEQGLNRFFVNKSKRQYCLFGCALLSLLLISFSGVVYARHGIVRDVPELGLYVDSKENMESQFYNDRNNDYDKDFLENNKKNVLIVGDSFARDWINILREANVDTAINISYHKEIDDVLYNRIDKADFIFVANNAPFGMYYPLLKLMMTKKFYRVGSKSFSSRNGVVYNNGRYGKGYYKQHFYISTEIMQLIKSEHQIFGDSFIDIMATIQNPDGSYPFFTPDHHFYSHDGIHLTKAGASELAKRLKIAHYFNIE